MKIPPELAGHLTGIIAGALARGWIDLRSIEPLLRSIVNTGNGPATRQLLAEVIITLERIENET